MPKILPILSEETSDPEWEVYAADLITKHDQGEHKDKGNQDCYTYVEELNAKVQ